MHLLVSGQPDSKLGIEDFAEHHVEHKWNSIRPAAQEHSALTAEAWPYGRRHIPGLSEVARPYGRRPMPGLLTRPYGRRHMSGQLLAWPYGRRPMPGLGQEHEEPDQSSLQQGLEPGQDTDLANSQLL